MDTSDPENTFDAAGVCRHCHRYDRELPKRTVSPETAAQELQALVARISASGKDKPYDCIIGVSGGVDSTYVAYLVKKLGLRPLAVHFDNGWNSETAVSNIEKTLAKLGIDLFTCVMDWDEFRALQLAFLRASTPDGEIPTDHAINALLMHEAARRGVRYVISGMNFATESTGVNDWAYGTMDWRYVKDVNRRLGKTRLKTFPHISMRSLAWLTQVRKIKVVSILNYVTYNKAEAMQVLQDELGWVYYGGKHYESVYTRFFQGYILPTKFGIDKRRLHLTSLIHAGQISRQQALEELKSDPYLDGPLWKQDLEFVRKKFKLSEQEFQAIMELPRHSFRDFRNSYRFITLLKSSVNWARSKGLVSK